MRVKNQLHSIKKMSSLPYPQLQDVAPHVFNQSVFVVFLDNICAISSAVSL
jgi:hypothetical protein